MSFNVANITLQHRVVGTKHVFTYPDAPELYVAHADKDFAERNVQLALNMIERAKARVQNERL